MVLFKDIGIPIKEAKTVLPCTLLTFLGIELDSVLMEKRLPKEKLEKIRALLSTYKNKKSITLRELQSIVGLLNFACSVVTPGRPFLRRLIDLSTGLTKPHHHRKLNKEARADLNAWSIFIDHFNGKSFFLSEHWENSVTLNLFTDASNTEFGGYLGNHYFHGTWPKHWEKYHITVKELFPIFLALELWSLQLQNKCIVFHTDNEAVMHIINKQTSKDKTLMSLVRRLVIQCLHFNILFQAQHIQGLNNVLADHLSRQQISQFLQKCPHRNPIFLSNQRSKSDDLRAIASGLIGHVLAPSTHSTYQRALQCYKDFVTKFEFASKSFPVNAEDIILFIAFCYSKGLASSTVTTYISALGYHHKIKNIQDPTQNFVVKKCLQGYQNKKRALDIRLPITPSIMKQLIISLTHTRKSYFARVLFKSMYLLAFHCFLRIGEFTQSKGKNDHTLQVQSIKFDHKTSGSSSFELTMNSFKHSTGKPHILYVESNKKDPEMCPVKALWHYFQVRKPTSGPLFSFMDGSAVSRAFFTEQLNLSLIWCGLDIKLYKGHSFRIGAASTAFANGVSEAKIKAMGRWSSDAYKKYIRVPVLKL